MKDHSPSRAPKWRKILYERLPFADNHVDASFLVELRKNISTRIHSLGVVIREAEVVSRQLSCVALFVAVFAGLSTGVAAPVNVVAAGVGCVVAGGVIFRSIEPDRVSWFRLALSCIPYLALCFGLSPILMTLTRTISEDTLYAMTVGMLLCYLIFYDYSSTASMVSSPVSLNAAFFASICLASRLPSVLHTFVIVTVALVTFALWPELHRKLCARTPPWFQDGMTLVFAATSVGVTSRFSGVGAILLSLSHLFVVVLCPAIFVRMQKDKHNIYGPWDEAVISD